MSTGMVIHNDSGAVLSPNITPIILHSINRIQIKNSYDLTTLLNIDRPIIAFGRPENGHGACAIFFEYIQNNGFWTIRVKVKKNTPSYIIYIFSNMPPKTPNYGYCFYNDLGEVIYHNECLPLKIYTYDITKGDADFDEDIAMQCGATGMNYSMTYVNIPTYVPSKQVCEWKTVNIPGYYEYQYVPSRAEQKWHSPKYEYKWVNGHSEMVQVPGYWETVTIPGYYKNVWVPGKQKQEYVCHWTKAYYEPHYYGNGRYDYYNSAVGDKKITNQLWSVFSSDPFPSSNPPPIDRYKEIKGINKFCYIKCSIYDKYYKPLK